MIIKNFTPHSITIFADTTFDPSIRKYRGGTPICTIPKADRMLSAHQKPQIPAAPWKRNRASFLCAVHRNGLR